MGSAPALTYNTHRFKSLHSNPNQTPSLLINPRRTKLHFSAQRNYTKFNRFVCSALEDVTEKKAPGSVEDKTEVADGLREDTGQTDNSRVTSVEVADGLREDTGQTDDPNDGNSLYNFFYPPKELLPEDKEMSIYDHLEELRERLFVSVLAVGAAIAGCFVYSKDLIMILEAPVKTQGVRFLQLAPGEFFFTTLKVSGYCGLLIGSPVILYEIIAFVLPGLTRDERRFLGPIVFGSSVLFYTGIVFSYLVLTPAALNFFVTYAEGVVESLWSIDQYFEFVLVLMFSTGLSFQVPVIQLLLGQVGLVSGDQMLSIWRYVVVGAVVAAAIVTPSTDPLTQLLLAGPLIGLYFGGAWTVKLIGR